MTNPMQQMRDKLRKRQAASAQPITVEASPIQIHHGFDKTHCYLQTVPPPANGVLRFTPKEYAAFIAEMNKVLAGFKEQKP